MPLPNEVDIDKVKRGLVAVTRALERTCKGDLTAENQLIIVCEMVIMMVVTTWMQSDNRTPEHLERLISSFDYHIRSRIVEALADCGMTPDGPLQYRH